MAEVNAGSRGDCKGIPGQPLDQQGAGRKGQVPQSRPRPRLPNRHHPARVGAEESAPAPLQSDDRGGLAPELDFLPVHRPETQTPAVSPSRKTEPCNHSLYLGQPVCSASFPSAGNTKNPNRTPMRVELTPVLLWRFFERQHLPPCICTLIRHQLARVDEKQSNHPDSTPDRRGAPVPRRA